MIEHNQPFDSKVQEIASRAFVSAEITLMQHLQAVHDLGDKNGTTMVYVATVHAGAALQYLARAIAAGDTSEEKNDHPTKESMLVAALMCGRVIIPQREGIQVDFSARNVIAAVEAAKVVANNPYIENLLDSRMLASYKEAVQEKELTLGYWDYLKDVGPSFDDFSDKIVNFTRH